MNKVVDVCHAELVVLRQRYVGSRQTSADLGRNFQS